MVSCAIFSSFSALKIKHRQQPLEGILPIETGIREPALFGFPFGQSPVYSLIFDYLSHSLTIVSVLTTKFPIKSLIRHQKPSKIHGHKKPRKWRISGVFRLLLGLISAWRTEVLCARPSSHISYALSFWDRGSGNRRPSEWSGNQDRPEEGHGRCRDGLRRPGRCSRRP